MDRLMIETCLWESSDIEKCGQNPQYRKHIIVQVYNSPPILVLHINNQDKLSKIPQVSTV